MRPLEALERLYLTRGAADAVSEVLGRMIVVTDDRARRASLWFRRARLYRDLLHRDGEAYRCLKEAFANDPDSGDIAHALRTAAMSRGEWGLTARAALPRDRGRRVRPRRRQPRDRRALQRARHGLRSEAGRRRAGPALLRARAQPRRGHPGRAQAAGPALRAGRPRRRRRRHVRERGGAGHRRGGARHPAPPRGRLRRAGRPRRRRQPPHRAGRAPGQRSGRRRRHGRQSGPPADPAQRIQAARGAAAPDDRSGADRRPAPPDHRGGGRRPATATRSSATPPR